MVGGLGHRNELLCRFSGPHLLEDFRDGFGRQAATANAREESYVTSHRSAAVLPVDGDQAYRRLVDVTVSARVVRGPVPVAE